MMLNQNILNHAKRCIEDECCGLVIDNQVYIPCRNIASDPMNHFEISTDDWIEAESKGIITAVVHSHPSGTPILSECDQITQQKTAVDWWLVCKGLIYKFRYMKSLLGREFKHGVMDCYTLFRDAYHLCGFDFPDFKRNDDWWHNGMDLYIDNMSENGFYPIMLKDVQEGDVILFSLESKIANHAAVYIGNNQILHHLPKRLSKRDLFSGYWLKHYHSIWRHEKWQPSNFTAVLNNMAINLK